MISDKLKERIKRLTPEVYKNYIKSETHAVEYDELTKFPELKKVIVDLLTSDFSYFLSSLDWVSPRPTTFRINLKNGQYFYLIFNKRSWIAQIEGKKYYLLNLPEEQHAAEAISRILKYGSSTTSGDNSEENDAEEDINFDDAGGEEVDTTDTDTTEA